MSDADFLAPHFIVVTVDVSGYGISITLTEDPIVIPVGNRNPLHWRISGDAGWKLDSVMISNGGTELTDDGGDDDIKRWKNNHTVAGDYKYSITFKKGSERMVLDPTIKNQ